MNNINKNKLSIVIPIYNDWESFWSITESIDKLLINKVLSVNIIVIDDGSLADITDEENIEINMQCVESIEIVRLNRNLGHQKAISIALAYIEDNKVSDQVIVMDGDGEDRPEDIIALLEASSKNQGKIIFASRKERSEGILFSMFYKVYKFVYYVLTGSSINFGNFCIIPSILLSRLVYISEIHNHFSAGCIRSKLPIDTIPTKRGKRVRGKSKMNLISLILHGMSAIAVHIDIVAVRILIGSIFLIIISVFGIINVFMIKYFTDLAIPGWATNVVIGLTIILIQAFIVSLILVFLILNHRTQIIFIPIYDYKRYLLNIRYYYNTQ